MKKIKTKSVIIAACVISLGLQSCSTNPETGININNSQNISEVSIKPGYPLVKDQAVLMDNLKLNRAIELFIWGLPLNQSYAGRDAMFEASKGGNLDVSYIGGFADHTKKLSTLNNETVYAMVHMDLKDGPIVYDAPVMDAKGYMFGSIIDVWQVALSDVGVPKVTPDEGKGGKYLILPPGYDQEIPEGYFPIQSTTNLVILGLRSIMLGDATLEDAINRVHKIKVYPLSNPKKKKKYIDVLNETVEAEIDKGIGAFKRFHDYVNNEPIAEKDKYMVGMLATLGIEKGKPFPSDKESMALFERGAELGWMTAKANLTEAWEPSYLKGWLAIGRADTWTPDYMTEGKVLVNRRASYFTLGIWPPKNMGTSTFYTHTFTDNTGKPLTAGKNYTLHLPTDVPVNSFWSVILYDAESFSMIDNQENKYTVNSLQKDLQFNEDGSIDIYFGPDKPEGKDSNWIPTTANDFWAAIRFYAPDWERLGKTWTCDRPQLLD